MSCSNHVGPLSMKHFTCDGRTGVVWPKRHKTHYTEVERGQITVANARYLSSFVIHVMMNFSRSSLCRYGGSIIGALKSWQRAQELLQQEKNGGRNEPPDTRKQETSGPSFSSSVCPLMQSNTTVAVLIVILLSQAVLFCSLNLTFLIAPLTAPLLILCRHWSLAFIQKASNLAPQQYTCQV